jgi:uncharacterized protein HemY
LNEPSPATPAGSEDADLATRTDRAWAQLRRGEYAAAHKEAGELRAQHPEHRDVLYLLAVSLRSLGRNSEALEVLE